MNTKIRNRVQNAGGAGALLVTSLLLTGCLENPSAPQEVGLAAGTGTATASSWSATSPRTKVGDDEVEAPEVFSVSEPGLWDGRPSLGGVWVAHVDATTPERVIVTEPETKKSVVAALFRHDSSQPGPGLRVSSDAAAILGLVPGAPTKLTVVALRRPPATPEETAQPNAATPADEPPAVVTDVAAAGAATASAAPTSAPEVPDVETAQIAPTPKPETTAATDPAKDRFVQIGIFSVEENARKTAADLNAKDLPTQVRELKSGDTTLWRVRVGPVAGQETLTDTLTRIKAMGFADAYATR